MTWCYLEVDAFETDILNKSKYNEEHRGNPGLEGLWEEEKKRRKRENKNSQITVYESQSRQGVKTQATEVIYKEQLSKKLQKFLTEVI